MNDNERRILEAMGCRPDELDSISIDIDIDFGPEIRLILLSLSALHRKVNRLMADLTALNAAVDALQAAEATAATEIAALRDEVAQLSEGTISQEQIDAITQRVTNVADALNTATAEPPAGGEETPPAEPPADSGGDTPPAEGGETPPEGGETPPPEGGEPSAPA